MTRWIALSLQLLSNECASLTCLLLFLFGIYYWWRHSNFVHTRRQWHSFSYQCQLIYNFGTVGWLFTSRKRPVELIRLDDCITNIWWLEGSAQFSAAESLEGAFQDNWKGQHVCCGLLLAVTLVDKRSAPHQWCDICALNSQAAGTCSACSLSCRV